MPSPSANKVNSGDTYSLLVGCIFMFNLILGTGALAMPHVFAEAGWLMGLVIITVLCFMSFVQLTFIVEALANTNFVKHMDLLKSKKDKTVLAISDKSQKGWLQETKNSTLKETKDTLPENSTTEPVKSAMKEIVVSSSQPSSTRSDISKRDLDDLKELFAINDKFEIGNMTNAFLLPWQSTLFFVSILAYMFGDLIIYNTMMCKSLREVSCTNPYSCNSAMQLDERCWGNSNLSRRDAYRLMLLGIATVLVPLTYAGLTKTKSIQVATIILRWLAFFCMLGISIRVIVKEKTHNHPPLATLKGFPRMFGICVYAFMCHHSVPSMLTPVDKKKHLFWGLIGVYGLVLFCYYLITMTGIFAFEHIDSVYSLNFVMNQCKEDQNSTSAEAANVPVLNIFLPSYPVFTIFSSYTVIALTLINNLRVLLERWINPDQPALKYTYPLIAIVPPMIVSLFTENVALIVSLVGAYTGSLIQYVFPSLLVYYSRRIIITKHLKLLYGKQMQLQPGEAKGEKESTTGAGTTDVPEIDEALIGRLNEIYFESNLHASPFQHRYWIYGTGIWWVFSVLMVTVDQVSKNLNSKPKN